MALQFNQPDIQTSLERLATSQFKKPVFGAQVHCFKLNPPAAEVVVQAFEKLHQVHLPSAYRTFITQIGNGGAGPNYGVFPLGCMNDFHEPEPWKPGVIVGFPGQPFPHTEAWNLPQSFFDAYPDLPPDTPREEQHRIMAQCDERDKVYWDCRWIHGAVPISDMGCALSQWLVVSGPEYGHVWNDLRVNRQGISPLQRDRWPRLTFADWYLDWLEQCLADIQ